MTFEEIEELIRKDYREEKDKLTLFAVDEMINKLHKQYNDNPPE